MKDKQVIGIDIGGTTINLGRFLADGTCTECLSITTPQPATPEAIVNVLTYSLKQLSQDYNCKAIGIGMPGPTDRTNRIARVGINLPDWEDIPLAELIENKTQLPTTLANDANCAAIGEAWLGAGQNITNFILLTLGTGVGGAIFINGKLFTGSYGAAGELGLITLNPDGYPCNSGNQGSLEQHACIRAVRRMTGKTPLELGELAQKGDRDALQFWQQYGTILGAGITSLIYVLTPEAVILGGGISASAEYFFPATEAEINRRVHPSSRVGLKLLKAQLGNNAGMIGAAKLALDLKNQEDFLD
ncbi:Transcriptional regulator/sugar kinase [Hyella patelloides LEGE 07179]|uniref:Transcriptional regulator/sugar kinase n=1 Tax=Hyella patelloides LEGE 07179 TaxID=945734 RepID=A0A563W201_9CYAN|nr:ROK family protein [Hyella patelloides]VEP17657.1 Transcriptional regulator/sugar kinase [Hyella patelloides LEGE 07179]